jgi:hypothetical protein
MESKEGTVWALVFEQLGLKLLLLSPEFNFWQGAA